LWLEGISQNLVNIIGKQEINSNEKEVRTCEEAGAPAS